MEYQRNPVFAELSEQLLSCRNDNDWWDKCLHYFESCGAAGICYGTVPLAKEAALIGATGAGFYKTNYPQCWFDELGNKPLDDDFSTEIIIHDPKIVLWHDETNWEKATKEQRETEAIERDLGMHVGITLPLSNYRTDGIASGIGVNMPDISVEEFDAHWAEYGRRIQQIAMLMDSAILRNNRGGLLVPLTVREKDVLSFLAVGYRPAEIALVLNVSEKTLEKHIRGAKMKLSARTRDSAVAKALILGVVNV